MLRAKNLHETLKQAIGGGVISVIVATTSGGLLAAAHLDPELPRTKEHALSVAVAVNVWRNYSSNDLTAPSPASADSERKPENLEFLIVDLAQSRMCIMGIGTSAIICVSADTRIEAGMLRLRASSLHGVLAPQIKGVLEPSSDSMAVV